MGLADLQTLADRRAERYATPKGDIPTKLDRAIEKKKAKADDEKQLAAWALKVKEHGKWKCRKTGKKLKRTRDLDPLRAEAHHIAGRADEAVRYDVRNGLCLSFAVHDQVTRGKLEIVGTQWFTVGQKAYIDGTAPVQWKVIA